MGYILTLVDFHFFNIILLKPQDS